MEVLKGIAKIADYLASNIVFQIIVLLLVVITAKRIIKALMEEERMNKENLVIRLPEEVKDALADAAYIAGSTMSQKAREYIIDRLTEEGRLDRSREKRSND